MTVGTTIHRKVDAGSIRGFIQQTVTSRTTKCRGLPRDDLTGGERKLSVGGVELFQFAPVEPQPETQPAAVKLHATKGHRFELAGTLRTLHELPPHKPFSWGETRGGVGDE